MKYNLRSTRCPHIRCQAYSTRDFRQHAFHFFFSDSYRLFTFMVATRLEGNFTSACKYCNNSLNLLCSTKENGRSCSIIIIHTPHLNLFFFCWVILTLIWLLLLGPIFLYFLIMHMVVLILAAYALQYENVIIKM